MALRFVTALAVAAPAVLIRSTDATTCAKLLLLRSSRLFGES